MRPALPDWQFQACRDPQGELDKAFGKVFATPDGKALLALLALFHRETITTSEVAERVARCRAAWGDRSMPK